MIKINNLSVTAGSFEIEKLSLTVNDSEYLILLGPTGAGKTVLIESVVGLRPVKAGEMVG